MNTELALEYIRYYWDWIVAAMLQKDKTEYFYITRIDNALRMACVHPSLPICGTFPPIRLVKIRMDIKGDWAKSLIVNSFTGMIWADPEFTEQFSIGNYI